MIIFVLYLLYISVTHTLFFLISASNFGSEAKLSIFLRFEPKNVLFMLLKLCGIIFQ